MHAFIATVTILGVAAGILAACWIVAALIIYWDERNS